MSILDLDATSRRDAGSIRTRKFATVRKGYDPDQVRYYLDQLSGWIEDLETDLAEARAEAAAAARAAQTAPAPVERGDDPFAALGTRVADLLRTAEDHAARVRTEADAAAERVLDEARQEALRVRRQAQEDSESLRSVAEEQAEATRRIAQEEADRVRDDAAHALENARVEAERTVATLSERRNSLAAELHATRSRLLGIVSQLEEAQQEPSELADEPATFGPEDRFDTEAEPDPEPFGTSPRTSAGIPSDDPRRDPLLPEIPRFVPPDLPKFVPAPAGDETIEAITPAEFPVPAPTEAPADTSAAEEVAQLEADSGLPRPSAAEIDGIDPPESGSSEIQAAATVEAPPEMEADLAEATPAIDEEAEESLDPSFLGWTTEEEGGAVDLSLPDFPTIDLPTLEDEGRNRN